MKPHSTSASPWPRSWPVIQSRDPSEGLAVSHMRARTLDDPLLEASGCSSARGPCFARGDVIHGVTPIVFQQVRATPFHAHPAMGVGLTAQSATRFRRICVEHTPFALWSHHFHMLVKASVHDVPLCGEVIPVRGPECGRPGSYNNRLL